MNNESGSVFQDEGMSSQMGCTSNEEFLNYLSEYEKEKYQSSKLRMKYNPLQLNYKRAIKAQTICEEANLVNKEAWNEAEHALMMIPDEEEAEDGASTIKKELNKNGYNGLDKMVIAVTGTMKTNLKKNQTNIKE